MAAVTAPHTVSDSPACTQAPRCSLPSDDQYDIDGMPIRDSSARINIKQLLSSAPQYDDDDSPTSSSWCLETTASSSAELSCFLVLPDTDEYEYGSGDGGEEDEASQKRKINRKSSLKATRHESDASQDGSLYPECSMSRKAVKFADALGLGLADVRALMNPDEPPVIPSSALRDLCIRRRRSKTEGKFNLAFDFVQPGSSSDFIKRLLVQKVVLENCIVSDRDLTVSGLVRVSNVAVDKKVIIRYTTDSWKTYHDLLATYVVNSSDGTSDRFMFSIHLPDAFGLADARVGRSSEVEFVVCYEVGKLVFWDNNDNSNYLVYCRLCANK